MGYGFQISRWFSLGLVVRYGQIVQPDDIKNQDPNDAQFITVGLDLAFGPAYEKKYEHECPDPPECKQEQVQKAEVEVAAMALLPCSCPDSDWDGVCDAVDRCPTEIGPPATLGCPIDPCSGEALVVLVQFEFDSASMPPSKIGKQQTMDPVLDAVAEAISNDPSCRVCIMGHASEEGPVEHNNELSLWRADAVQSYLVAHGLDQSLMPTIGKGVSCPLVPETSLSLNRRVEFIRLDEGETCPLDCSY